MQEKTKKWLTAVMFIVGTILAWGGMLYATQDTMNFRPVGILISLIGYGAFFGAAIVYESTDDKHEQ